MITIVTAITIGIALFLVFIWKRWSDPRLQIKRAEKLLKDGNGPSAYACFLRVIARIETGKRESPELKQIAARAHLAVAQVDQDRGDRQKAMGHYRKAKAFGAELAVGPTLLLAECYAEKKQTSPEAVEAYLTYLSSGPSGGPATPRVHAAMQEACEIAEDMEPADREPIASLNRRVIATNSGLEWSHYFLGLANILDRHPSEAIRAFTQARKLNPNRSLTCYWLATCHLQLPVPAIEAAMTSANLFLSHPHRNPGDRYREACVCSEIALKLIRRAGGLTAPKASLSPQQIADLEKAIRYLMLAAERKPDAASIHHILGQACRLADAKEQADTAFRMAAQLNPGEQTYAFDLGLSCMEFGRISEAIAAFQTAIRICPTFDDAHGQLGAVYFEQGSMAKAVAHLKAALRSANNAPRLLGLLIRGLCSMGQHARATAELDRRKGIPSSFQGDVDAAFAAGRSYSAQGRFAECIEWLKQAPGKPEAIYHLGCAYANLKGFASAKACFDQLSGSKGTWAWKGDLQRAHILLLHGDDRNAAELYRQVLAADLENSEAMNALGSIALVRQDVAGAISLLSRAADAQPTNLETRFLLGLALERKGDFSAAIQNYEAVSHGTKAGAALLRLGVIRCRLGEFAEALNVLERCPEEDGSSNTLLFYRGLASIVQGRCEDAIRDWSRLQKLHPDYEKLRVNLARAHYALGSQHLLHEQFDAAIEQWELYLAQFPQEKAVARDIAELHFRKALEAIQLDSNDSAGNARKQLQEALRLDPENQTFRFFGALCNAVAGTHSPDPIPVLEKLAAENWRVPRVLYHLGWCHLLRSQPDFAGPVFQKLCANPDTSGYHRFASWALANSLIEQGDFLEASSILRSAMAGASLAVTEPRP